MAAVPYLDVGAVNARQRDALAAAAARVIDSGRYILGDEVAAFERAFAAHCGARHCIGVASGLDALTLLLRAAVEVGELTAGDEVIVPANTYIATVLAVLAAGLSPVAAEANVESHNLDGDGVRRAADAADRVRAVLAVHLYGRLAAMDELQTLCRARGWLLFEDAAQAAGACAADGARAGALSDAAGFSFYPSKNLGALGDGGAVVTDSDALAEVVRALGNYGSRRKYHNEYAGVNSRLDPLQAALLSVKLPLLDDDNARRRAVARRYLDGIVNPAVELPRMPDAAESHVWHIFAVRCRRRDALAAHLLEAGVETVIHYPLPPHRQPALAGSALAAQSLPAADALAAEELSLPISPVMDDAQVDAVIAAVNGF